MTLAQYLVTHKYSRTFRDNYVVPMCAAVWSVPNANVSVAAGCNDALPKCNLIDCLPLPLALQVLEFPVQMLIRFWVNHHLLDIFQRPLWRVIKGRSRTYVDKVISGESICQQRDA